MNKKLIALTFGVLAVAVFAFGPKLTVRGSGPTMVTSCGALSASGTYQLANSITSTSTSDCITINNVNNVKLDCANFSVTAPNKTFSISNAKTFIVQHCTFLNPTSSLTETGYISSSSQGSFIFNTVGQHTYINVQSSTNLTVSTNTFNGFWQQYHTTATKIQNNTFALPSSTQYAASCVISALGGGNYITNNNIDGGWTGVYPANGSDDGVIISDESNDTIASNTIAHTFDVGIEFSGIIQSSTISNNAISHITYGGIGGWYWFSMSSSTIANNTVNDASKMFEFEHLLLLRSTDTGIYFTNNHFTNNTFTNPNYYYGSSTVSDIDFKDLPANLPTSTTVVLRNNTLTGNDFTHLTPAPNLLPTSSMIVDGGGNTCVQPSSSYPLTCL